MIIIKKYSDPSSNPIIALKYLPRAIGDRLGIIIVITTYLHRQRCSSVFCSFVGGIIVGYVGVALADGDRKEIDS